MIYALYSLGYLFSLYTSLRLRRDHRGPQWLFLIIVSLIPIGKLFYFPVPFLMGFKFCFLLLCLSLVFLAMRYSLEEVDSNTLFPLAFLLPAVISLPFLKDPMMLLKYAVNDEQVDSVLARLVSLFVLAAFSCWVAWYIAHVPDGFRVMATVYVKAVLFATVVGFFIFALVFAGKLQVADLDPISAETHIFGKFYRFNPGANVNEFGMLLGYATIFVLWLNWPGLRKFYYLGSFLLAQFLTLNRACWIGMVFGLVVYIVKGARHKLKLFAGIIILLSIAVILIGVDPDIQGMLVSRAALDMGPGGVDRLEHYGTAYHELMSSPWRLLFGFGWSTNLYLHSVPLQLLYETGLVGILQYIIISLICVRAYLKSKSSTEKSLLIPLLLMMAIFGLVQHTLYHMQTWLIIGVFWGICLRNRFPDFQPAMQVTGETT